MLHGDETCPVFGLSSDCYALALLGIFVLYNLLAALSAALVPAPLPWPSPSVLSGCFLSTLENRCLPPSQFEETEVQ